MTTNTNSPVDALPIGAGDREAGHTPGSASRTLRERVADAIECVEFGYRLDLTRLVDGEQTYTLTLTDGTAPTEYSDIEDAHEYIARKRYLARADAAIAEMMAWQPIESARKDGTPIWAALHSDIYPRIEPGREDLKRWNGLQLPIRHAGLCDDGFDIGWGVAAPVGHGGFPDEWIAGFLPLPSPPKGEK